MNHDHHNHNQHAPEPPKIDEGVVYTCPMHPEIKQDKPGMCIECGMNLVPERKKKRAITDHEAHDEPSNIKVMKGKHAGHSTAMFLRKFWVSLILTIPVVLYADIIENTFSWSLPDFPGSGYVSLLLSSIIFFYGGWVFLIGAWREIKGKLPGMMTLIAIAISAAYLWSIYAVFARLETLFWELTTLITVMLLGHWLEMRAVSSTQSALKELSKLLPDVAEVVRPSIDGEKIEKIPLSGLQENDIVLIRPGARIPADGEIINGESDINESMVTGESKPVFKSAGSHTSIEKQVIAGTINGDGALKVKVANIGERTFLASVMRMVAEAQASKSRLQILSDQAARYLTGIAVAGGIITLIAWLIAGAEINVAVARLVAVLVVACPHALGLAVPLVASISTTKAAQNGFLVKQRLTLETARTIDTVLFDKTGTLTLGEFGVDMIFVNEKVTQDQVLQYAASINAHSEHPLAKSIVAEAQKKNTPLFQVKDFSRIAGKGAKGNISESVVYVGNEHFLSENEIRVSREYQKNIDHASKEGKTVIHVIADKKLLGSISLVDIIREESREAIQELKIFGIKTAMITGDSEDVAAWVSRELDLDEYFAKVMPDQKAERVRILQKNGRKVAMVGDGINDAPALTQANLGIAIGAGTNVAIESAGIILVKNDPRDIPKIFNLSRLTYRKMIQNLFWASGYNIITIPLAAGVLVSQGIVLQPAFAAVLMSISTIIVAFNAMLLRNKRI